MSLTDHRTSRRFRAHIAIHVVLILAFFLPGGLVWNRVEPMVFQLPFGVFVWTILLPGLIVANMLAYVVRHWAEDKCASAAHAIDAKAGVQSEEP